MPNCTVTLTNKLGLHARAAMKLSELALRFSSKIMINYNDASVNAKSILNIMVLGATVGQSLEIVAEGSDEDEALKAMSSLIEQRFGETE